MLKYILRILAITLFIFPRTVWANEDFAIDAEVTYDIRETGTTQVTHDIVLTNNVSDIYATSYTLGLSGLDPQNIRTFKGNKELKNNIRKEDKSISIEVIFDDAVVGKGNAQRFSITFEEDGFATKSGEVWEVYIPRLSTPQNFNSYKVNLLVPHSFGERAFISPEPTSKNAQENKYVYIFEKEEMAASGISAGFGEFQVFSFSLSYHLENPLNRAALTQIAIPPDTAFQRVYYQSIDPQPEEVVTDDDGNWLAVYKLKPRERVDISAIGAVQIYSERRKFPRPTDTSLNNSLKETEFWQINDPKIVELAKTYDTPRKIYDYVSQTLSYNYDRVRPNVERMGASLALSNPNQAICMEFTDAFIAIARAAGIPAREVNGFAYSENPEIQPLSLVADVLHAWPEYWDSERQAWIPVDPTWGATTGGVDYFSKLDLRHFAFVHHDTNPTQPYPPGSYKLGPNPQKDVFVSFGQLPQTLTSTPEIIAETNSRFPLSNIGLSIKILNKGPSALYDLDTRILFDDLEKTSQEIKILPPFSNYRLETSIPFSFLGRKTPEEVKILVSGEKLTLPGFKQQVIVYNLITLFIILLLTLSLIIIKIKRINPAKIGAYLKAAVSKKLENETPKSEIQ